MTTPTVLRHDNEDGSHSYATGEGVAYDSVTTILNPITQADLVDWAARQAVWATLDMIAEGTPTKTRENKRNISNVAAKEYERIASTHAGFGTRVHEAAPLLRMGRTALELSGDEPLVLNALTSFEVWMEEWNPEFISEEEVVFDHELKIAGTYDSYGLLGGVPTLFEFKTSRQIYATHCVQAAMYAYMIHQPVEQVYVIQFNKYNAGEYDEEQVDVEAGVEFFKHQLHVVRNNNLPSVTLG